MSESKKLIIELILANNENKQRTEYVSIVAPAPIAKAKIAKAL